MGFNGEGSQYLISPPFLIVAGVPGELLEEVGTLGLIG